MPSHRVHHLHRAVWVEHNEARRDFNLSSWSNWLWSLFCEATCWVSQMHLNRILLHLHLQGVFLDFVLPNDHRHFDSGCCRSGAIGLDRAHMLINHCAACNLNVVASRAKRGASCIQGYSVGSLRHQCDIIGVIFKRNESECFKVADRF